MVDGLLSLLEGMELLLPDTLFFEAAKKPLDDPILLRPVRRDELLLQSTVPTGSPKLPALEDQPIVAAEDRRFHRARCLLGPTPQGVLGPQRNFFRQSSTFATVSPWVRAASATDVSAFKRLTTSATRRLAVHRSI